MGDPPVLTGQPVVLVADDDAMICKCLRIALEAAGMFVLTASDGKQALELSQKFPSTIHALVADVVMPNLDGLALCEQILLERPAIRVLLMSGTADAVEGVPFLRKPFKLPELTQKVWQLLAA
jgi:CheY-like chemotaxis protein